jgi:hypothetical protein
MELQPRHRATVLHGTTTHALFTPPSSPSVIMPSDIIALPTANVEVLKQRLDALVVAVEAAEEKATRQLLEEEQAAAADLERQAAAKKLVPGSTSFSTTETVTASLSYVDTIIASLHIQADTMMEEIHLDTSGPAAAPTAFYSNKILSAPLSPPLAPPRPPGKNNDNGPGNGNGSNNNRHRNNNRRNGGNDGKNSDNGGNRGGHTSSNTTVVSHGATTNDSRGPPPWPTYVNPSQGHIAMYPSPSPTGQQRSQAFLTTTGPYTLPGFVPGQQQLYQQAPPAPPPGWAPWNGAGWDLQSLANSFSTMALQPPATQSMTGLPTRALHTTPLIQSVISSTLVL